jgi:hypothetical protein
MSYEAQNPFTPNVPVKLANIDELPTAEDIAARFVDPEMTDEEWEHWMGRRDIRDFVRPPKVYGTLANIELTPLEDPYETLEELQKEGFKRPAGSNRPPRPTSEQDRTYRLEHCLGFYLVADALSTGKGTVGEVQLGMWYVPTARKWDSRRGPQKQSMHTGGRTVMRILTQSRLEKESFIRLGKDVARIALSDVRNSMLHPSQNDMHE